MRDKQNQFREKFVKFCVDVIRRTGRKDLLETSHKIEQREKELLAWVDEAPGMERAERAIKEDEDALENELRPKLKVWTLQLEKLEYLGRAGIVDFKLDEIRLRELEDQMNQIAGELATPTAQSARIDTILEKVHHDYIQTFKALLDQLRTPLRQYHNAKALALAIPKIIYLLFTLVILAIGASLFGEQLEGLPIKLAFAIAIWGLREFFITPVSERALHRRKKETLKQFISKSTLIKLWSVYLAVDVEHDINEKMKREEGREEAERTPAPEDRA